MNFALMISCKVEDKLALIERDESWTQAKEAQAYEDCLKEVLEEDGRAWADGNIRIGDYILLGMCLQEIVVRFGVAVIANKPLQLILIPVCLLIVYLTLLLRWSNLPRLALCNTPPGSCRLCTTISKTELLSSPTLFTLPSVILLPMAMLLLSLGIMLFFDGPLFNKFPTKTRTGMRSFGPNRTYPRISICPCDYKSMGTLSDLLLTPEKDSKRVFPLLCMMNWHVGKSMPTAAMSFCFIRCDSGLSAAPSLLCSANSCSPTSA